MFIVILLDLLLRHINVAADFFPDNPLRDDAVLQVLFEFLEGNALRLRRLLHVFHRLGVHLLADFIQPLDHLGVGRDAHFFALLQ